MIRANSNFIVSARQGRADSAFGAVAAVVAVWARSLSVTQFLLRRGAAIGRRRAAAVAFGRGTHERVPVNLGLARVPFH
jgi:hypothetical protein